MLDSENAMLGVSAQEEFKSPPRRDRLTTIPMNSTATRRATDVVANQNTDLFDNSPGRTNGYSLHAALNDNPRDLHDMNERNAMQHIL